MSCGGLIARSSFTKNNSRTVGRFASSFGIRCVRNPIYKNISSVTAASNNTYDNIHKRRVGGNAGVENLVTGGVHLAFIRHSFGS